MRIISIFLFALIGCGDKTDNIDSDGDGFTANLDCDDNNADINPDAVETCNGIDDNCDGETDDGVLTTYYADADLDGFGNPDDSVALCEAPPSMFATLADDCNDGDNTVFPGATEMCDGQYNDCLNADYDINGAPNDETDNDSDGYVECGNDNVPWAGAEIDGHDDCDDDNSAAYPGAPEWCDGQYNDCDNADFNANEAPAEESDDDGDGFVECDADSSDWVTSDAPGHSDCDDDNSGVYPGAEEICDGHHNDCDSASYNGAIPPADESDDDGDLKVECTYDMATWTGDTNVDGGDDCDDNDPSVYAGAPEVCDGQYNDCSSTDYDPMYGVAPDEETDNDGDGYVECAQNGATWMGIWLAGYDDCNDDNPEQFPDRRWYYDGDLDGYGDPFNSSISCTSIEGYTEDNSDCDDSSANIRPGAGEKEDGDGKFACMKDEDGDGHGEIVCLTFELGHNTEFAALDPYTGQPMGLWVSVFDLWLDGDIADINGDGEHDVIGYDMDPYWVFSYGAVVDSTGDTFCRPFALDGHLDIQYSTVSWTSYSQEVELWAYNGRSLSSHNNAMIEIYGDSPTTLVVNDQGGYTYGDVVWTSSFASGTDCDDDDMFSTTSDIDGDCDGFIAPGEGVCSEWGNLDLPADTADEVFCDCADGDSNTYPGAAYNEMDIDGDGAVDCSTDLDGDGWANSGSSGSGGSGGSGGGSCPAGQVDDCDGTGECCPESWVGDGFADCQDQAWGCDLTCYDCDGGDCPSSDPGCSSSGGGGGNADAATGTDCDDTDPDLGSNGLFQCPDFCPASQGANCDEDLANHPAECGDFDADCDGTANALDCAPFDAEASDTDIDGDGQSSCQGDCDDYDPTTFVGSADLESDSDGDGVDDLCTTDADNDGYGALDVGFQVGVCYMIDMTDSFGDGWNGCAIGYTGTWTDLSGNNLDSITLEVGTAGSDTFCLQSAGDLEWIAGSWTSEVGFVIYNMGGVEMYNLATGGAESWPSGQVIEPDGLCDLCVEGTDCNDGTAAVGSNVYDSDCDGTINEADCDPDDPGVNEQDYDGDSLSSCAGDCDDFNADLNTFDIDNDMQTSCDGDCDDNDADTWYGAGWLDFPELICTTDADNDGYAPNWGDTCFDLEMWDAYGDGWNGGHLVIYEDGVPLDSGLPAGYDPYCANSMPSGSFYVPGTDGYYSFLEADGAAICSNGGQIEVVYTACEYETENSYTLTGTTSGITHLNMLSPPPPEGTVLILGTDPDDSDASVP